MGNGMGLASLGIGRGLSSDADTAAALRLRRGEDADWRGFLYLAGAWVDWTRWLNADAFAPAWQKPLIAGGASRKTGVAY